MGQSKNSNDAVPDDKPANEGTVRRVDGEHDSFAAPDLGGSFEENGQVRRPAARTEGEKAAAEAERNSSAGS